MTKKPYTVEMIKSEPSPPVKYVGVADCCGIPKHVWFFHCSGCRAIVRIFFDTDSTEILIGRGEWKRKKFKVVCDNPDCRHIFYLKGLPKPGKTC